MAAGGSRTDILRFQQSLVSTTGGSNRSPETIRAICEACRGLANAQLAAPVLLNCRASPRADVQGSLVNCGQRDRAVESVNTPNASR